MTLESRKRLEKSKLTVSSIVMYVGSTIVALIALAFLIDNIILFKDTVAQYVGQGYPSDTVVKQLIPSQLLPGVFESVALYGGIALILFAAGLINHKAIIILKVLTKAEDMGSTEQAEDVAEIDEEITKAENEFQQPLED